jgi:rhodanese-related sulfurtransferase/uncharacterized protein YceK
MKPQTRFTSFSLVILVALLSGCSSMGQPRTGTEKSSQAATTTAAAEKKSPWDWKPEEMKVWITRNTPFVDITTPEGKKYRIMRIQDTAHEITGDYARTSRPCPPFCVHSIIVDPRVKTIGEAELVDFLKNDYNNRNGLLVDARTPSWYNKSTIPGSINVPHPIFSDENIEAEHPDVFEALYRFGVTLKDPQKGESYDNLDFSGAKKLALFCNGPWCGQSPREIRGLLKIGYPPEKMLYYRGGMQIWNVLGLTTVKPEK